MRKTILACLMLLTLCCPAAPYLTNKVWLVIYDPFPTNSGVQHLWEVYDPPGTWTLWNDPNRQNIDLTTLLTMDTHTNIAFICTRTNIFRFFPRLTNGKRYYYDQTGANETNNYHWSYESPWVQRPWPNAMLDYDWMLTNDLNAEAAMGTGECDDIWVWAPPMSGAYESHMFGPGSWWCNSGGHTGNNGYRAYPRRFIVYCYNYERGTDMANHDFGHAMESNMSHVNSGGHWNYGTCMNATIWTDNYWTTFAAFDQAMPGRASCGDNHRMPNSTNSYEYRSSKYVWSFKRNWEGTNWLSWPRMFMSNSINYTTWNSQAFEDSIYESEGECSHLRWWFQHMPHEQPDSAAYMTNGLLMNWYEYLWNCNSYGLPLQNGIERYDGPLCDLRGYSSYYIDVPATHTNRLVITTDSNRNVDLYLRKGYVAVPQDNGVTYGVWDAKTQTAGGNETIELTPTSTPPLTAGRWYITVSAPYQSSVVRGWLRVTAQFSSFLPPPVIQVPVLVPAASNGMFITTVASNIVIQGTKATGMWLAVNGSTNDVAQTLAGDAWQYACALQPLQTRTLAFTVRDASGIVSAATRLSVQTGNGPHLFAYDGMDYGEGALLAGANGGFNWLGAWGGNNMVATPGLAYYNNLYALDACGNCVQIKSWQGESHRQIGSSAFAHAFVGTNLAPDGTSIWCSFVLRQDDRNVDSCFGGFYLKNALGSDNLYIGKQWATPHWRIEGSPSGGITISASQTTNNQATLIVLRLDFKAGNDDIQIWFDPLLGGGAPDDTNAYLYNSLDLRFSDLFIAAGGATFSFDELRIGDTWAAVTPATPIPEPAGLLLLAVLACAFSQRHHRGGA